ncbi:MAG: Lar family restriction alleviation protein [Pyrinomonadaceae bacterium]
MAESERVSRPEFSVEEVLQILRNVCVDVECGACCEIAFTGITIHAHSCGAQISSVTRRDELRQGRDADAGDVVPAKVVDLLPCPFCGEAGVSLSIDSDIEAVVCHGCTASGPSLLKMEHVSEEAMYEAVERAWNERFMTLGTGGSK